MNASNRPASFRLRPSPAALAATLLSLPALAVAAPNNDNADSARLETLSVVGANPEAAATLSGAAAVVDNAKLEAFEYDDVQRILDQVPGVNIRGEDGYGLRPNIGLRGTTTERSQKITLMEDGVLIAPAPYAAPAAYYFPMVSRMTAVEVVKGPASIEHGPNTIGGAINLVTRDIPYQRAGGLDLAAGTDQYAKLHAHIGDRAEQFGWLVEGLHVETDGFKNLPNNDDTGFSKNDVMIKLRFNSDSRSQRYQQWDLKLAYADELSHETYLGLSDQDLDSDPYQRYAASQLDEMDWEFTQIQLRHLIEWNSTFSISTVVYRHDFERHWFKLNRFAADRPLSDILASPEAGLNANFFAVLTGAADSDFTGSTLLAGDNGRTFYAQGLQSVAEKLIYGDTIEHRLRVGLRIHEDQIERHHTEDSFLMTSGTMVSDGASTRNVLVNEESAQAFAAFVHDRLSWQAFTVDLGLRLESIDYTSATKIVNDLASPSRITASDTILLPSVGIHYQATETLGLLGGVHRGFVPAGPGQASDIDPETSINYEAGLRWRQDALRIDLIGFFSDYRNLIGVCTFSSGCTSENGAAFNGGEVQVYGLEALLANEWQAAGWRFPVTVAYSFTDSEFQSAFETDFPLWGAIQAGDQIPYIPRHKLHLTLGAEYAAVKLNLGITHTGEQDEQAGTGGPLAGLSVPAYTVIDVAGHYRFAEQQAVYAKLDNLADKAYLLSRRPYGARPGKPRSLVVGYKLAF